MRAILIAITLFVISYTGVYAQQETTSFEVNGVKVIFKPTLKTMVSVRVYFRGGVTNYTAQQAGIERFALSAAITCGTKNYTPNQYRDTSDRYGISMSNAAEFDYGSIDMSCISKYFEKGWGLLSDAVKNPAFDDTEVQLLRTKIISSIEEEESAPDKRIEQLTIKNAFAGTQYAIEPDGTTQSITALTTADLKNYYAHLLNKNRMFIVIAGKLSQQQISDKVAALVADLPSAPYEPAVLTPPIFNDNRLLTEQSALATNYINGVMNAPPMSSPDYLPFRLGMDAFGGALFSELRSRLNLSYDPGAYSTNTMMPYAVMYVSTTKPKDAVDVMINLLNHIKTLKISDRGLNQIKSSYIVSNYSKLQSSTAITGNLGNAEIMGGWYYFDNAPAMLEQVTPEQVAAALKKYIVGVRWAYRGDLSLANEAAETFKIGVQ